MQTVSITPKWQIHIPVAMRKQLGLTKPTQADVYVENNTLVIKPKKSKILQMGGSLQGIKPTRPINIDKIRDYIDYSDL
ncbi:AbrB/MazE/SpoVT family DNA-binding domain-containing protein [Candidatus Roizmanbacteria bacterium]|nr:AbrB/MazE/SpoVT family DNA-binding domain-containing protein [Candidatus Roizmanbacteria bacterium]